MKVLGVGLVTDVEQIQSQKGGGTGRLPRAELHSVSMRPGSDNRSRNELEILSAVMHAQELSVFNHGVPKHEKQVTFSYVSDLSANEKPDT